MQNYNYTVKEKSSNFLLSSLPELKCSRIRKAPELMERKGRTCQKRVGAAHAIFMQQNCVEASTARLKNSDRLFVLTPDWQ